MASLPCRSEEVSSETAKPREFRGISSFITDLVFEFTNF